MATNFQYRGASAFQDMPMYILLDGVWTPLDGGGPPPPPVLPDYLSDPYYDSVVAFEGAMGYGANTTGGRGNGTPGDTELVFVDNLNDSGAGSLRAALERTGKRVIVPRVGGYVQLATEMEVDDGMGDFTFLGQLAPGGGLGVRPSANPSWRMSLLTVKASNVVMRYLSMRMGETRGDSTCAYLSNQCYNSSKPLRISGVQDGIFDHISAAFGTDANIDIGGSFMQRVTLQNSLLTHPLANAGHYEEDHAFNSLHARGSNLSLLYNMYANAYQRSVDLGNYPKTQFIGNVIYNVRYATLIYTGYSDQNTSPEVPAVDLRRNTYKHGPMTHPTEKEIRLRNISTTAGLFCPVYIEGNESPFVVDPTVFADQKGIARMLSPQKVSDSVTLDDWAVSASVGTPEVEMMTAAEAFAYVLANAGNNITRDSLDTLVAGQANGTKAEMTSRPETMAQAGGYPAIAGGPYPTANSDGIPTGWRTTTGESRAWYELDTGGTGRMVIENYADDVAQGRYGPAAWASNQAAHYDTIVPSDLDTDLFVDFGAGNDTNDGTSWAQAYATMEKAATDLAGVGGIVKVRGTRTTASEITITSSGASVGSRIEFWADGLYGAKVDANGADRAIQLNTDYVEINGFEIYDATYVGVRIYKTGDYQTTGAFHNRIRYCYIHDIRWPDNDGGNGGSYISAHGPYSEVDSCFIQGRAPVGGDGFDARMQGIYGRGSWIKITNNLVTNIRAGRGIQLYFSDTSLVIDCEVVGNTVLHCYDGGIQVQAENALVANNILAYNDGPGIRFFGSNSHATVENNLFYDNSTDVLDLAANYTNTSVNGVSGDPGFINYQADGTGDYKITSASPAYQAASPTHATAKDYFGSYRQVSPTIGFHEVE